MLCDLFEFICCVRNSLPNFERPSLDFCHAVSLRGELDQRRDQVVPVVVVRRLHRNPSVCHDGSFARAVPWIDGRGRVAGPRRISGRWINPGAACERRWHEGQLHNRVEPQPNLKVPRLLDLREGLLAVANHDAHVIIHDPVVSHALQPQLRDGLLQVLLPIGS